MNTIPDDILKDIFSYITYHEFCWLNIRLTSKRFLEISKKVHDPSILSVQDWERIITACNLDAIRTLIQDERSKPPVATIYYALQSGKITIYYFLIDKLENDEDFDINWTFGNLYRGYDYEAVDFLIKHPISERITKFKKAADHACRYNEIKLFISLVENKKIDPSADDNKYIKDASTSGRYEIVRYLLKDERVDPSSDNNYAIKNASAYGYHKVVELLLNHPRVDPSADDNISLQQSIYLGYHKVASLLLKHPKVDPSANHNYAIFRAYQRRFTDLVKEMLKDKRVNPSDPENCVFTLAIDRVDHEFIEFLLQDPRVDPSVNDNYAIKTALNNQDWYTIGLLLKNPRLKISDELFETVIDAMDVNYKPHVSKKQKLNE